MVKLKVVKAGDTGGGDDFGGETSVEVLTLVVETSVDLGGDDDLGGDLGAETPPVKLKSVRVLVESYS
jgi:hypothetical protein